MIHFIIKHNVNSVNEMPPNSNMYMLEQLFSCISVLGTSGLTETTFTKNSLTVWLVRLMVTNKTAVQIQIVPSDTNQVSKCKILQLIPT